MWLIFLELMQEYLQPGSRVAPNDPVTLRCYRSREGLELGLGLGSGGISYCPSDIFFLVFFSLYGS